jgi:hypothetical protein
MNRSSGPRETAALPESIHHQLNMYAIAAGAAGVSMLTFTNLAEARIVYTPTRVSGFLRLDVNNDNCPNRSLTACHATADNAREPRCHGSSSGHAANSFAVAGAV